MELNGTQINRPGKEVNIQRVKPMDKASPIDQDRQYLTNPHGGTRFYRPHEAGIIWI
jgi:hypothetical protein